MKILFLSDDFPPQSYGGAGMVAFNLAKALVAAGHEVAVITTVRDRQKAGRTEYNGLEVHKLYSDYHERWRAYRGLCNPSIVAHVRKIINGWYPDVVHAHNIHYHLSYHCLKIAKENGAKVFLTAHDTMLLHYGKSATAERADPWSQLKKYKRRYNPFRNLMIRYYLKYVDKIFAVSQALEDALNKNGLDNVEVVRNGIDVKKWQATDQAVLEFKNKFNLNKKKVILFGGRLSEPKGGEKIIRITKRVVAAIPEAVLLVLGRPNDYSKKMIKLAKEIGIGKNVVLTGWISGGELIAGYHASDVVVTPSLYLDPFPTVNLEAMACGKPVIGTCFGGTKEIVKDKVTGFLINPFNIEEVEKRIKELLDNRLKAERFGKAGYDMVVAEFTLEWQVRKVLQYYQEEI